MWAGPQNEKSSWSYLTQMIIEKVIFSDHHLCYSSSLPVSLLMSSVFKNANENCVRLMLDLIFFKSGMVFKCFDSIFNWVIVLLGNFRAF